MIPKIAIPSTGFIRITRAYIIAICLGVLLNGDGVTAPTFLLVLGGSKDPSAGKTSADTSIVAVVCISILLNSELSGRVVFFVTTKISESCRPISGQWSDLLSHGIASKVDELLAEIRVASVHNPLSDAGIYWNVDLGFGNRTK